MRSRFFSASSYDDEEEEYDEQMDLSGFVTSAPPAPPVIERKRSPKPAASSMGNAGPKMYATIRARRHFATKNHSSSEHYRAFIGNGWRGTICV